MPSFVRSFVTPSPKSPFVKRERDAHVSPFCGRQGARRSQDESGHGA